MDVEAVLAQAQLLTELERWDAAIDLLSDALAEHPHDSRLLARYAAAAYNCSDLTGAYAAACSAMDQSAGTSVLALEVLAHIHLAAEITGEAVGYARRAVEYVPHDADAHMLLATCLSNVPSKREAGAAVDRALELDPGDPDLFVAAAAVAKRIGDGRTAQFIAAGLEIDPSNSDLQAMAARERMFAGEQVDGLTAVLAEYPTHRLARHALAQVVWGTIARLAAGVWIYALAVILLSAWVSPGVLRHLVPVLMAPLIVHWTRLFLRVRRRLPHRYLSRRLRRSPSAALGIGLAGVAALIANLSPVLITRGWSPDGVRLGYQALIFACVVAGLAHLLVTLGRLRADGDVDLPTHLEEQSGYWAVWLLGMGVPIAVCWACHRLTQQPGALWFALMVVPIVLAVRCVEATVAVLRVGARRRILVVLAATLFVVAGAGLVLWCGQRAAATDFRYTEGPLSPSRITVPTVTQPGW